MRLRKLQREYDDLAQKILDLKARRHNLRYGHLIELKLQESLVGRQGNYFLKSIAEELQQEYWAHVKELDELRKKMR